MARVVVTVEDLEGGAFPDVCVTTGQPTQRRARWEFKNVPGWTWILIFFGIVPFFVARYFAAVRFHGILPMSEEATRKFGRLLSATWVSTLAGLAVFLVAILLGEPTLAIAGLAAGVVGSVAFYLALSAQAPDAVIDQARRHVRLEHVHPAFVEAVRTAESARANG